VCESVLSPVDDAPSDDNADSNNRPDGMSRAASHPSVQLSADLADPGAVGLANPVERNPRQIRPATSTACTSRRRNSYRTVIVRAGDTARLWSRQGKAATPSK